MPVHLPPYLREVPFVLSALTVGFLIGLFILVPALKAARFWNNSSPIRHPKEYSRRSLDEITADWNLYKKLERDNAVLGPISRYHQQFRANLVAAADDVIERYANSSNPNLGDFDWKKARFCLTHALEMDASDHAAKGKLALSNGYLSLLQDPPEQKAAKSSFEEAASYLPRSPDPHLGLARLYIYSLRKMGSAVAEFHQAERLGFKLGPREMEQQADGYLARAENELRQAERMSKTSPAAEARYLALARGDFARASSLYEPIDGFSNVSVHLMSLNVDRSREEELQAAYQAAHDKRSRTRRWR